jgi:tetratricopeptide (TPR) repeat protein
MTTAIPTPHAALVAIDAAVCHERWLQARALAAAALRDHPSPALHLAAARLDLARGGGRPAGAADDPGAASADEVLLELATLDAAAHDAGLGGLWHELRAAAWCRKRLPALAREAVAAGLRRVGPTAGLHVAQAGAALIEDDRPGARDAYLAALALVPDHGAARHGLGSLLYVMASFGEAEATLAQVPASSRHWARRSGPAPPSPPRSATGRPRVAAWRRLLEGRPDGDLAQSDRISLGLALAASGDRAGAMAAMRAAWQADPDSGEGRYARERMTTLEAAPASARRYELTAFPTTAQKWNYCGPAVLELVLRYFEYSADQDSIAAVVKRGHGTPMYEIVRHLAGLGVEARRFEATAERIRAAIDLGCPGHRPGGVLDQLPRRGHHRLRRRARGVRGAGPDAAPAGGQGVSPSPRPLASCSATAPSSCSARRHRPRAAALDVTRPAWSSAPHLRLVDECSRRRPRAVGGDAEQLEELSPAEIVRLCDQALEQAPSFRLALHRRHHALADLTRRTSGRGDDVLRDLMFLRLRFGGEEWVHQLHARSLLERGLYDEAFVEAMAASGADPHDEHNLQLMGEACWLVGDLTRAERYLRAALAEGPDCARAAENLAAVYLRAIEEPAPARDRGRRGGGDGRRRGRGRGRRRERRRGRQRAGARSVDAAASAADVAAPARCPSCCGARATSRRWRSPATPTTPSTTRSPASWPGAAAT